MKKIVLTLTVLMLAAPAFAATTVTITAEQVGDTDEVAIRYVVTGDPCVPRAFGLDITVTDGNIVGIKDFNVGECNATIQGFGIFPGKIDVNSNGEVDSYGDPIAPQDGLPGDTLPGLDSNGVTIELGSLRNMNYPDGNKPALEGTLCHIVLDATVECDVYIEGNAARTGSGSPGMGVVMEDPALTPTVLMTGRDLPPLVFVPPPTDCMLESHPDYANWLYWNKPDCWCYVRQCRGDVDGKTLGPFWVSLNDLTLFRLALGKLEVLLPPGGECSDFDHKKLGPFWVSLDDLTIIRLYLGKMAFQIPECDGTHINFWIVP